jgi:hypothetical protein
MSSTTLPPRPMPTIGAIDSWRRLFASLRAALRRDTATADNAASRVEQAASLRAMALKYLRTDPGFGADLLAAADYHERGPHAPTAPPVSKARAR